MDSYAPILLGEFKKHTVQSMSSDSQTNESYELVLFSEPKTYTVVQTIRYDS